MDDDRPQMDDREPADAIDQMVDEFLAMAQTWTTWDGKPIPIETPYGQRLYTPNKALRRMADHMIDHLAQLDAHNAGLPPSKADWQASRITTPADMAPITKDDLDEAASRIRRLAMMWRASLVAVGPGGLDTPEVGGGWSPREMAFHTLESMDYANHVGDLSKSQ
jgi:hypothetical protein